jgi:hypothetical protein
MADELVPCPICDTQAKPIDKVGDADGFECVNHGRFRVAGSVFAIPAYRDASRETWEDALKRARERQPGEWAPTIITSDFERFIVVWTIEGNKTETTHSTQKAALHHAEKLLREHGCNLDIVLHLNRISPPPSILFNRKWLHDWCRRGFGPVL